MANKRHYRATEDSSDSEPKHHKGLARPAAHEPSEIAPPELARSLQRAHHNPHHLKPSEMTVLQRTLGNRAVRRLIQRKPADINQTHALNYDEDGNLLNTTAPRTRGEKRPTVINAQLKDGWVTPSGPRVMGGHLFKAEFGGPDDETNVVPWVQAVEDQFAVFEKDYKTAADTDAKEAAKSKTRFTAQIKTKATFADRNDLKVSDSEMTTAGWTDPADADYLERKAKFDDVAERFSGIPTTIEVKAEGVAAGPAPFVPTDIAPHFVRNDLAIGPTFGVPARFLRHATNARTFVKVSDWGGNPKDISKEDAYQALGHVGGSHGIAFSDYAGLVPSTDQAFYAELIKNAPRPSRTAVPTTGPVRSPDTRKDVLRVLEELLVKLIADSTNFEQIVGTYMGIDVTHYYSEATNLYFCINDSTKLLKTGFKLGPTQKKSLLTKGVVK